MPTPDSDIDRFCYQSCKHDVVMWKYFPHYWTFIRGASHKGPVIRCFDVSFGASSNKLLNKQPVVGNLRRLKADARSTSHLSWKVQNFTPSLLMNSNATRSRLLAFSTLSLPSSHGLVIVGPPNGSNPTTWHQAKRAKPSTCKVVLTHAVQMLFAPQ